MALIGGQPHGLKAARLLMVISSFTPLFVLWSIRGMEVVPDHLLILACVLAVVIPNAVLFLRIRVARHQADRREVVVGAAEDHRDHILVYLFAMLLPFYSESLSSWRELAAACSALAFVIFLFWHLHLHYMNLIFAVFGFRVFTVYPPVDGNPLTGRERWAVLTRRASLVPGDRFDAYRISDTVFLEV